MTATPSSRTRSLCGAWLFSLLAVFPLRSEDTWDVVIRGGRVLDGTGNPGRTEAIGIRAGRIGAVGRVVGTATRVIDATGCVVAPGFIDVHTHADDVAEQSRAENFVRMGVTTVIVGNYLKLSGNASWGRTNEVLAAIEAARRSGLDVTQDQYVYTASSTGLSQLVPEEYREGGRFSERLADPAQKSAMKADMRARLDRSKRTDYRYAVVADFPADRAINGLTLPEVALKTRGASSLEDQIETILELQRRGGGSGIFHGMSEEDLRAFARHPGTMFASDSGVREFGKGVPHPRGYGNNARVLGRYVRETGLLGMEDAVRRMTSLPAATFRLKDRGQIREGAWADVVVFDPAVVTDRATFGEPHQYATGFRAVLVNGVVVVQEDRHTGAKPGQALRRPGSD